MGIIDGNNIQRTVRDPRGRTNQELYGHHNAVTYKGDRGANTFHVGGTDNIVDIRNVGRDDMVYLEGNASDWQLDWDSYDPEDGMLRGTNLRTGNNVTIRTDRGRDDDFLWDRIRFTGVYSADTIMSTVDNAERDVTSLFGGGRYNSNWNDLGYMGNKPWMYDQQIFTPRDEFMFDMGRIFGNWEANAFPFWSNPFFPSNPWLLLSSAFNGGSYNV